MCRHATSACLSSQARRWLRLPLTTSSAPIQISDAAASAARQEFKIRIWHIESGKATVGVLFI